MAPFIAIVRQYGAQEGRVDAPENSLFGEGFAPQERNPKPKKSAKNEAIGVRMFLEFVKVQEKGLVDAIQHMDDWLCGLAKFVVRTSLLYDDAEVIQAMNKRKEALAKDVCPKGVRNLSVLSMVKTMVNAVFKDDRLTGPGGTERLTMVNRGSWID